MHSCTERRESRGRGVSHRFIRYRSRGIVDACMYDDELIDAAAPDDRDDDAINDANDDDVDEYPTTLYSSTKN